MTTQLERRRTFPARGSDGPDLEAPVDALGRMRHRVKLDRRTIARADDSDDTTRRFAGHAAVFSRRTLIGGKRWGFWESIAPGAFTKTIGEADVRFLVNHDPNLLLARSTAGTLDLAEDSTGLATEADLDTRQSYTNDVVIALERGDISQMSFAFEPIAWRYEEADDDDRPHYVLTEVRLWDVSIVTYPAYEDTDAGLRAAGFAALARSLGVAEGDLLAQIDRADVPDLREYVARQISPPSGGDQTGPAESTRDTTSGPAESTRDDRPPAESTGTAPTRSQLRRETLRRAHRLMEANEQ